MKRKLARAGIAALILLALILVVRALRPAPDTPIAFLYQLPGAVRLEAISPDGSNRITLSGSNTTPAWLGGLASRLPAAQRSSLRPVLYADLLRAPVWIGSPASVAFQSREVGANCENVVRIRLSEDATANIDCLPVSLRPEDFAWAPNGALYAYAIRDALSTELRISAVDGEILLTSPLPSSIWGLSWSPDSNHLAVNLNYEFGIRIYSPLRFIYELQAPNYAQGLPAWSPNGQSVAFLCRSLDFDQMDICTIDLDGSNFRQIAFDRDFPFIKKYLQWSPDGNKLLFAATQGQADGSGLLQLTTDPHSDSDPAWSPDSSTIVFSSNRNGNWDLYTIQADGTGLTRLTDTPGDELEPTWRLTGE